MTAPTGPQAQDVVWVEYCVNNRTISWHGPIPNSFMHVWSDSIPNSFMHVWSMDWIRSSTVLWGSGRGELGQLLDLTGKVFFRDKKNQAFAVDKVGNISRPDLYTVWGNTCLPCFLGGDEK